MKKTILLAIMAAALFGCSEQKQENKESMNKDFLTLATERYSVRQFSEKPVEKEKKTMTKTMKIEGMMCGHCEARVKKTLEAIEGVTEAVVSHEAGTAVVSSDVEISSEVLKNAVTEQGYDVISVE